jgi:transposase
MARAYSFDLRKRVIDFVLAGSSCLEAGAHFGVSESSAIKWTRRFRDTGLIEAKPTGGDYRSQVIEASSDKILAILKAQPDITLMDMKSKLLEQSLMFSKSALARFLIRHGQTLKKRRATLPSKVARMS